MKLLVPKQYPITDQYLFDERRVILKSLASLGLIGAFPLSTLAKPTFVDPNVSPFSLVSSYNNYYEFTTNKKMVKHVAKDFQTSPWQLSISGLIENPLVLNMNDILDMLHVSRVNKLRCVEGWSAIIPWQGIELSSLLKLVKPLAKAKYVKFIAQHDPSQMIGQRHGSLPWPYVESLRLDEAMHPLTIIATGMYGDPLTNQNGAPLRLVVPWKYGYKSIKAITHIELVSEQPISSWQQQVPSEYGFFANVNPKVPHPRWSQRREVMLGETKKIKTQMLNGYEKEVAELYKHDDLNSLF
jgi:sulfoxide reductase catalytic subunit YedY